MSHAERLGDFLTRRERVAGTFESGSWLIGRSKELECVASIAAADWLDGRTSEDAAATTLARYLRDLHDGMAMHLDIVDPSCCQAPLPAPQRLPTDPGTDVLLRNLSSKPFDRRA